MSNWLDKYSQVRSQYERFASDVEALLRSQLKSSKVGFYDVESRAKSLESARAKAGGPQVFYEDPFSEIHDLAGVRVIVYRLADVNEVVRLCRQLFEVIVDKVDMQHLSPDRFGYESAHLAIQLDEARCALAEWAAFADMRAEVQVRTLLQHSWATTSHALQYKREASVPHSLRRRLSRVSALLELADSELDAVTRAHSGLRDQYSRDAVHSPRDWNADLNTSSLREFVAQSPVAAAITADAISAGFTHEPEKDSEGFRSIVERDLVELISFTEIGGTDSIGQMRAILETDSPGRRDYFASVFGGSRLEEWSGATSFFVTLAYIRAVHPKISRNYLLQQNWADLATGSIARALE